MLGTLSTSSIDLLISNKIREMFTYFFDDRGHWYIQSGYYGTFIVNSESNDVLHWYEAVLRILYPVIYASFVEEDANGIVTLYPYDVDIEDIDPSELINVYKDPELAVQSLYDDYCSLRAQINIISQRDITRNITDRFNSVSLRNKLVNSNNNY